jgi:DnaJ-class molecular chaperone
MTNKPEDGSRVKGAPHLAPGDDAQAGTRGTGENLCPECQGTGLVGNVPCQNCNGTGIVTEAIGGG